MFNSIISADGITAKAFFICLGSSILLGLAIALVYTFTTKNHTAGFIATLAMIPAVVQVVILLVNGNLGAGIAVAGAFSLIRFRSIPGTAKEIGAIFIALATGLASGMGYVAFAVVFAVIMLVVLIIYNFVGLGKRNSAKKILTVVIPESINYDEVFDDILSKYTADYELVTVKTTNMGSLFKLTYEIVLKNEKDQKKMIDEIRTRNANLEISCNKYIEGATQL